MGERVGERGKEAEKMDYKGEVREANLEELRGLGALVGMEGRRLFVEVKEVGRHRRPSRRMIIDTLGALRSGQV